MSDRYCEYEEFNFKKKLVTDFTSHYELGSDTNLKKIPQPMQVRFVKLLNVAGVGTEKLIMSAKMTINLSEMNK